MKLKDKVAVIIGGSSNIGKMIAQTFADQGAKILIADFNELGVEAVAKQIEESGGEANGAVLTADAGWTAGF